MASFPAARPTSARASLAIDAAISVAIFAASIGLLAAGESDADGTIDVLEVCLVALASLPLVARRAAPIPVFALTALASIVLAAVAEPAGPPLGPTLAIYWMVVGSDESRDRTRLMAALVVVLLIAHATANGLHEDRFPLPEIVFGVLVWGGAWLAGDRTRLRHERMAELEERALRAERDAERERRLAAAEERTRIARDLHDSAGHAINVILVHAGLGRLRTESDPPAARAAFETIEEVARETVGEIDQMVRALREDGSGNGEGVEPPPGVAALDGLVERHRAAGLDVTAAVSGRRPPASSRGRPGRLPDPPGGAHERGPPRRRQRERGGGLRCGRARAERVQSGSWLPCRARRRRGTGADRHARARRAARRKDRDGPPRRELPGARAPAAGGPPAMTDAPVRVLIVDDDQLMRAGLRGVLSSDEAIEVVGEAADGRDAVYRTRLLQPDIVLMDVRMPDVDGISATGEVLAGFPEVKVVMLTTFEEDDYIFGALSAGASGFLLKRTSPEELIAAIHTIAAGDSLLSPSVTSRVIERMAGQPAPDASREARLEELTPREREVLALVARGLSNSEIGAELVIEESTVKTHVKRVLTKLGARDRVQAVIFAFESGLAPEQRGPGV